MEEAVWVSDAGGDSIRKVHTGLHSDDDNLDPRRENGQI